MSRIPDERPTLLAFPKPDPIRASRAVSILTQGFADSPTLHMQKLGRALRKPKPYRPRKAKRVKFNPAATLRPIAWGERDKELGDTLCAHLRDHMPAIGKGFGEPWAYKPRFELPAWVGYGALAIAVIAFLAGAAR